MKQSFLDKHFDTLFLSFIVGSLTLVFVGIPVAHFYSASVEQKAINKQCGTDYSLIEVFASGKNLTELCRIKQQEILLKQK